MTVRATTVYVRPNGPYIVTGDFALNARAAPHDDASVVLCRCGQSSNQPYCDGTHTRIGFVDAGVLPADIGDSGHGRYGPADDHTDTERSPEMRGAAYGGGGRRPNVQQPRPVPLPLRRFRDQAVLRRNPPPAWFRRSTAGRGRPMTGENDVVIEAWNTVLFDKFCRFKHLLIDGLAAHSGEALARHGLPTARACWMSDADSATARDSSPRRSGPRGGAVGVDCAAELRQGGRERSRSGAGSPTCRSSSPTCKPTTSAAPTTSPSPASARCSS